MSATVGALAFIGNFGPWEMGAILLVVMIFFGAGRLPEVFRAMGQGVKAFKDGQRDALDAKPEGEAD